MKKYSHPALKIKSHQDFVDLALINFQSQYQNVPIYKRYVDLLSVNPKKVNHIKDIPFLPISVFKTHKVSVPVSNHDLIFKSSGTTGTQRSTHFVKNSNLYHQSFRAGFKKFYGDIEDFTILALLPSYLEQGESSLVYMVRDLIQLSKSKHSGFYLNNYADLVQKLKTLDSQGQKTILLGVSYALLDLTEQFSLNLQNTIIMETGGMKGRRKEMIKEELHSVLKKGFGVNQIHSEYGMTELLSQAYSKGNGIFKTPPWMKVLIRDASDPLSYIEDTFTGGINIIDLFNQDSCCFIATQDLGKTISPNTFEVLGRFDYSDIRGCNLLLA